MSTASEVRSTEGRDVTVFVDRLFLIKALQFGLSTIGIIDEISPCASAAAAGR